MKACRLFPGGVCRCLKIASKPWPGWCKTSVPPGCSPIGIQSSCSQRALLLKFEGHDPLEKLFFQEHNHVANDPIDFHVSSFDSYQRLPDIGQEARCRARL